VSELKSFYSNLIAAVGERDLARVQSLIDPAFVIHYDASLPFGGRYEGMQGFFTVLTELGSIADLKTEPVNYMESADGENYTLIIDLSATTPSGRAITTQVSEVWTVRDGKAVEARVWFWGAAGLFD
jgi:ketosteroid isomerase-like protein